MEERLYVCEIATDFGEVVKRRLFVTINDAFPDWTYQVQNTNYHLPSGAAVAIDERWCITDVCAMTCNRDSVQDLFKELSAKMAGFNESN